MFRFFYNSEETSFDLYVLVNKGDKSSVVQKNFINIV